MTLSEGSSSGCQRTPRTKSPPADSIASMLSSSVAQALADRESGISIDALVMMGLDCQALGACGGRGKGARLEPHLMLGP